MTTRTIVALSLALICGATSAQTQVAQLTDARCKKEVKDYVEAMRFVRESAGSRIGDKVARGYVTEAELNSIVDSKGPCAAAQLLREKGAQR